MIYLQEDYHYPTMDEQIPTTTHLFVQTLLLWTLIHGEGAMNINCSSQGTHPIVFLLATTTRFKS